MKLIILCAVLSAVLAVSLASPVKTQKHNVVDTSDSSESTELNNFEKNSSSSEEEEGNKQQEMVKKFKVKDNNEEKNSADTSEEQPDSSKTMVKDEVNEDSSVEDDKADRFKRAVDFASHASNQITVKDKGAIKYNKYLKLKQLRRALDSDESKDSQDISPRFARSADTSEENSSEEEQNGKAGAVHTHSTAEGVVIVKKPDTAPAETLEVASKTAASETKPEAARRRRNIDESSEEEQSVQERDVNEVFIFSNEQQDSEDKFKSYHLKNNEYVVLNEKVLEKSELSMENKNSEEDYAQGCGGSNGDDSNESNDENNETINDKL